MRYKCISIHAQRSKIQHIPVNTYGKYRYILHSVYGIQYKINRGRQKC